MSFLPQYFTSKGSDEVLVVTDILVCHCQPNAG